MATPPPLQQPNYYGPGDGSDRPPPAGMAVASMVCGIVSVPLLCLWPVAVVLAIVAIVLGLMARGQARRGVASGRGMATAGVVCGGVTIGVVVAIVLVATGVMIANGR